MSTPSHTALAKSLHRMQRRHSALLAKVERTGARLERRTLKLGALESALAELERRIAEPPREGRAGHASSHGMRHAQLIFNPFSGKDNEDNAARLSNIVSSLRAHGIEVSIGLKTSGKSARKLARDAVRDGLPLVVVAAGDGTISAVASQLVGSSTVLGLVPIGTMNNLARSLGVPLEIEDACALIGMGTSRHIDAGRVRTNHDTTGTYFLECAGVGLAAIGSLVGQSFEKRRWRALPRALWRFFETRPGIMHIDLDGTRIEASTQVVTVSNSPLMGSNLLIAPDAKMDDGYLDVSIYEGMGDAALFGHFLAASAHRSNGLKVHRARRVRITTEAALHASSELSVPPGHNVIDIEVVPGAFSMIVGKGIGLTLPIAAAPASSTYGPGPGPHRHEDRHLGEEHRKPHPSA